MSLSWEWPAWWTVLSHVLWRTPKGNSSATHLTARSVTVSTHVFLWDLKPTLLCLQFYFDVSNLHAKLYQLLRLYYLTLFVTVLIFKSLKSLHFEALCWLSHCVLHPSVFFMHCDPLWPSSQSPATCTVPSWALPYPYRNMAAALFPIMLCLHLTHQTVAVPAARAPAQITTRQLIELFFSSQAGGHCKNIPTLEYGFLVQVRPQEFMSVLIPPVLWEFSVLYKNSSQNELCFTANAENFFW